MASISLDHLWKRYGLARSDEDWALRDVSLEIRDGELLALLGPSGSGKTTLLRLIAGLETLSRGEVRIGGQSMAGVKPRDRGVAMVFQESTLYAHLDARRNLAFALRMRRVAKAEIARRIADAARWLDIEALLDRKPGEMSAGERQRVALAKAIVQQPRVLLLDEPLSSLDAPLRADLRAQIKSLQRRLGVTLIYVTHDQNEAMALGDRVAVLACGQIQQVGTAEEIRQRPVNRFVAGFIGDPGMNFIEGRIEAGNGPARFVGSAGEVQIDLPGKHDPRMVVLGVRPEHCTLAGDAKANGIGVQVELIEHRSASILVHTLTERGLRLAVIENSRDRKLSVGERASVVIDARSTMVFEPGEFGRAI